MDETPETLRRLQELIEGSAASAGPAIQRNFIGGGWSMSAEEFVAFWKEPRMASISTVSEHGYVHVAPLEPRLVDGKFYIPTFPDSQRLRDHRTSEPSLCHRGLGRTISSRDRLRHRWRGRRRPDGPH